MPPPTPIRRGWPDFQSPAGAGTNLLLFDSSTSTNAQTFGPFDVSSFESIQISWDMSTAITQAMTLTLSWSAIDAGGVSRSLAQDSYMGTQLFWLLLDQVACRGPILTIGVNPGSGGSYSQVFSVVGKNGPPVAAVPLAGAICHINAVGVGAGLAVSSVSQQLRRGLCSWYVSCSAGPWRMTLFRPNLVGGLDVFFQVEAPAGTLSREGMIPIMPWQIQMTLTNVSGGAIIMAGSLTLGTM